MGRCWPSRTQTYWSDHPQMSRCWPSGTQSHWPDHPQMLTHQALASQLIPVKSLEIYLFQATADTCHIVTAHSWPLSRCFLLSSQQLSSRQSHTLFLLSSRQLSSRQLSSRQLSSRQLSSRQSHTASQLILKLLRNPPKSSSTVLHH